MNCWSRLKGWYCRCSTSHHTLQWLNGDYLPQKCRFRNRSGEDDYRGRITYGQGTLAILSELCLRGQSNFQPVLKDTTGTKSILHDQQRQTRFLPLVVIYGRKWSRIVHGLQDLQLPLIQARRASAIQANEPRPFICSSLKLHCVLCNTP